MSLIFPSEEFFSVLQEGLAADAARTEGIEPSEAYCGFSVGEELFVFEFDGRTCAAVVRGGNPIDLDFVLAGPREVWLRALALGDKDARSLEDLLAEKELSIESGTDDGPELARAALPMLQAFLDQARDLEVTSR